MNTDGAEVVRMEREANQACGVPRGGPLRASAPSASPRETTPNLSR